MLLRALNWEILVYRFICALHTLFIKSLGRSILEYFCTILLFAIYFLADGSSLRLALPSCSEPGLLLVGASLLPGTGSGHGLWARGLQQLQHVTSADAHSTGSVARSSDTRAWCPLACVIFLDQGSDLCPVQWQDNS